jgi:hypothetical protein
MFNRPGTLAWLVYSIVKTFRLTLSTPCCRFSFALALTTVASIGSIRPGRRNFLAGGAFIWSVWFILADVNHRSNRTAGKISLLLITAGLALTALQRP